jgi:hypothetical protein
LTARILYLADQLELDWGISMIDTTGTGSYLSSYGEAYFTSAIPNIKAMAPNAFAGGTSSPDWTNKLGTLYEYYNTGDNQDRSIYGDIYFAQTFTVTEQHRITLVTLKIERHYPMSFYNPDYAPVNIGIKATDISGHPTGDDLCSGTIEDKTSPFDAYWADITLGDGVLLEADTKYAIVVSVPEGNINNYSLWRCDTTAPSYDGGNVEYSTDAGATWDSDNTVDFMFLEWEYYNWDYAEGRAHSPDGTLLDLQPLANWWGISRMWTSSLLFVCGTVFILYTMLSPNGNYRPLVFLSIPLFIAGGYLGMIPLLLTVLIGFFAFALCLWMMFYHPSSA